MDETQAHAIGERLARAIGASSEDRWAIKAALMQFPSDGANYWLPRESFTVQWLDGQALVAATAVDGAGLRVHARPIVVGEWLFDVSFESASLDDAGFAHPGLKARWSFQLPNRETFEIDGETLVSRDSSNPNEAEKLARQIALRMMEN